MSIRSFDGTFRFTAFRTAIARRLVTSDIAVDSSNYSTADDPVRDLLGMTDLRDRVRQAFQKWWTAHGSEIAIEYEPALREFCRELFFWTSADRFFAGMSDADLYCPVPICLADDRHRTWEDLTDLLLKTNGDSHGLLISARSGGGKTVGSWCAWFRCFSDRTWIPYPNQPEIHRLAPTSTDRVAAPLAGFMPVWIDVADNALPEGNDADFIMKLIARQCLGHLKLAEAAQLRLLERYLQLGSQKFLLFFDLNHAPAKTRDRYADALIRFQKRYGPQLGHRCIVIYRVAGQEDKILHNLTHQGTRATQFVEYDLLPLDDEVAIDYLSRIRKVENDLFGHLDRWLQDWSGKPDTRFPRSEHDPETELSHLKRLLRIRRRAAIRQRGADDDLWEQETVISIPLLMHWVSTFPPEVLNRIKTLADIYAQLTQQHLQREESDENRTRTRLSSEELLIAMQRLALAMLAQKGKTRLSAAEAKRLLTRPQGGNPRIPVRRAWMPIGELLTQSLTYSRVFTKEEVAALFELGLLRKTDDSLGFAHDSLIYYFAARALREYEGIGLPAQDEPLEDAWPQVIAETFLDDPARWLLVAEFLGEMVQTRDEGAGEEICRHNQELLRELVSRLVTFWPDLPRGEAIESMRSVPELVSRLCSTQPQDRFLRQVYQATNDHSQFAWEHPHLLLQEVINRCCWFGAPGNEVEQWARQLEVFTGDGSASRKHNRPEWLKKKLGLRLPDTLTIEGAHTNWISSVAVYAGPDGPRIVSTGADRRIVISDPQIGTVERTIESAHTDWIRSVTVYAGPEGPRIVSVGRDQRIVISNPDTGTIEQTIVGAHIGWINSVAIYESPDGPRIVSVGDDKRIVISDPDTGIVKRIIEGAHTDKIRSVTTYDDPEGPQIVSAGDDSRIVIRDPRTGTGKCTIQGAHSGSISSLAVYASPDGPRIVTAGLDGRIVIRDPWTETIKWTIEDAHTDWITSVAVYSGPDGPWIVSVGRDQRIVISNPRTGTIEWTIEGAHTDSINSVIVYSGPDSLRIVSVGRDQRIVITDPRTGTIERTIGDAHTDWIRSVAMNSDSDDPWIASVGRDKRIVISDPRTGLVDRTIIDAHIGSIRSVAVYSGPDGLRIVSAGNDKRIVISNPLTGTIEWTIEGAHTGWITSVAVYYGPDGPWIVTAGWDKRIVISNPLTGTIEWTIEGAHTDSITCVTVFSGPDGLRIVSVGRDRRIVISNPDTGTIERTIEGAHTGWINSVAIYESPDGPRIISVGKDQGLVISNPRTGTVERTIKDAHTNWIRSVTLYAALDDSQIISVGEDKKIKLWNIEETLIHPDLFNTLFVQANCLAIDQSNSHLICGVDKHLEVYEFVTDS
ncbi:WD40 repeat domain-containing protein [Gimesia chilikensis]|uniref:WD domain, G-beta repeat n=1 Tax=Gimesia chilikensis TaxID=2605989 RepID=A0A517PT12_9PLAN|nr:WD40 repeat domain-containing protein [Gimesia chilikensis]QDT22503.1 WD domain, G-beta repeat [Gimesia chilikensis]